MVDLVFGYSDQKKTMCFYALDTKWIDLAVTLCFDHLSETDRNWWLSHSSSQDNRFYKTKDWALHHGNTAPIYEINIDLDFINMLTVQRIKKELTSFIDFASISVANRNSARQILYRED
jgi:hypothetical protein